MNRTILLSLVIVLAMADATLALSINVGDIHLLPNAPGQVVPIYIDALGGELLQGINFRAQLGDGGPIPDGNGGFLGHDITPAMVGDITGPGTLFHVNSWGVNVLSVPPSYVDMNTFTTSGYITLVPGANVLAILTFDTTGFTSGSWPLLLSGTLGGDTNTGGGPDWLITNGSVTVVPEPSTLVLAALGLVAFAARGWRRSKP